MSNLQLTPVYRLLRPWWRLTRGMTLGVQGIALRDDAQVLLIRHGYRPGWHFPGGGVEWRETLAEALAREVREEAGIVIGDAPVLHGMFANFATLPSDHIAVFVLRGWTQPEVPRPTAEIAEQRYFALDALPPDINGGTARRLAELAGRQPVGAHW